MNATFDNGYKIKDSKNSSRIQEAVKDERDKIDMTRHLNSNCAQRTVKVVMALKDDK